MLTDNLALLVCIYQLYPEERNILVNNGKMEFASVTDDSNLSLVLDPFSPNLNQPKSVKLFLKRQVISYLNGTHVVKNHNL